jgi:septal ring factor EnvC (AmiA/AmiB activator)
MLFQMEHKISVECSRNEQLEFCLKEKDAILKENSKHLSSFQKEINQLLNKQQEIEYALMQSCNERDKQSKLIDELTKKYIFLENEKNDIENLVNTAQHCLKSCSFIIGNFNFILDFSARK